MLTVNFESQSVDEQYPNESIKKKQDGGAEPIKKYELTHHFGILTCICEFRPGDKIIWVVFDEESDLLGPRT